jgi:hypothetical protein
MIGRRSAMAKTGPTMMAIKVPVPIVTVCLGLLATGTKVGLDWADVLVPVATASLIGLVKVLVKVLAKVLVKVLMNVLVSVVLCSVAVIVTVYILVYREYIAVLIDGSAVFFFAEVVVVVVNIPVLIVIWVPGHVAVSCIPSEILPQTTVATSDGFFWHSTKYIHVVSYPVFYH